MGVATPTAYLVVTKGVLTPDMVFQALLHRHQPRSNLGPGILIPLLSCREKPARVWNGSLRNG
jgi:hypothetical protein